MKLTEIAKYVVYRLPVVSRLMSSSYPYKVDPGELCAVVNLIEQTRSAGGAVMEIGVAQGDSSVFLLEHLRSVGDERPLLLFDTFAGFTPESIEVETKRGKRPADYDRFRYGDEELFRRRLRSAGYANFRTCKGDASTVDWGKIGPIGAVLLDIDLYAPTKAVLEGIYPQLSPGGGIVVDDCLEDTPDDGAMQAYSEFIAERGLPFERVGRKGAVIRKPAGA